MFQIDLDFARDYFVGEKVPVYDLLLIYNTRLKKHNARVVDQYLSLQKNYTELEETYRPLLNTEKLASIGTLAAAIAHEINNPLTIILGYTGILLKNADLADIGNPLFQKGIGNIDKAARAIEKIVRGTVRKNLGPGSPIFFRINAEERIPGGQTLEEALFFGRLLADEGVDVFDVSLIAQGGWKENKGKKYLTGSSVLPKDQPSGANVALAVAFKKQIKLPVIAVGKFGIGNFAVTAVEDEDIDMIAIGRQIICDPRTSGKMLGKNDQNIIPCDDCLKCFATIGKGYPMGCKVNQNLPF